MKTAQIKNEDFKLDGEYQFTELKNKHDLIIEQPIFMGEVVKEVNGSLYIAEINYSKDEFEGGYWFPKRYCNPDIKVGDTVDVVLVHDAADRSHGLGPILYMNHMDDYRSSWEKFSVQI